MKHICKILLVMCCVCLCSFSGCDEKNDLYEKLDTKKAEQVALEYMIEKYGEGFSVVSSKKEYEAGYVPASIQSYWCDVELTRKDSETMNNYIVRVTLKDNGEKPDYVIEWDNYMTSIVTSLIKRDIERIVSESINSDYFISSYDIGEKDIGGEIGHKGFSSVFKIDLENDSLSTLLEKYNLCVCFRINIPDSTYKNTIVSELKKDIERNCLQAFSSDYIKVGMFFFDDDYYSEIKKISESGNELPLDYEYKSTHEETIKIN